MIRYCTLFFCIGGSIISSFRLCPHFICFGGSAICPLDFLLCRVSLGGWLDQPHQQPAPNFSSTFPDAKSEHFSKHLARNYSRYVHRVPYVVLVYPLPNKTPSTAVTIQKIDPAPPHTPLISPSASPSTPNFSSILFVFAVVARRCCRRRPQPLCRRFRYRRCRRP